VREGSKRGQIHPPPLTFDMVRPVTELQGEDVVDRSAAVQQVGVLVVADESVLSSQDQYGPVDELQGELLVLTWREKTRESELDR